MDEQTRSELEELRSAVVSDLAPIIEEIDVDSEQRFRLLLASAELSPSRETYEKAHKAALQIEDQPLKAQALLDLLESIDISIGDMSFTEDEPQAEPTDDSQPSEPEGEEHHQED